MPKSFVLIPFLDDKIEDFLLLWWARFWWKRKQPGVEAGEVEKRVAGDEHVKD